MKSLRLRLVAFTLAAVAAIWLATAYVVWREAAHELADLLDHLPPAARSELAEHRDELIEELAEHVAMPVLASLPVLAALLAIAVTLALRPLQRLARDVAERAPDRLEPLVAAGAPSEIHPLIGRLNELFAAIARALDNERRLTADAAHELRTPLAALKAQAQVALAADDAAQRRHALEQIVAGCDRATRLVEQLLMLARLDAAGTVAGESIDLHAVAADVLTTCADLAVSRNAALSLAEAPSPPAILRGDPVLIGVLLRNLVDNALRHTAPGTEVTVAVERHPTALALVVSDCGAGIAADLRAAPGQRFRRGSDTAAPGSGLGLSIVQRIAALHQATLTLRSGVDGSGTVATVRFPVQGGIADGLSG